MVNIKSTRKRRRRSRKRVKGLKGGQPPLKVAILFVGRIKGYDEPNVKDNLRKIKEKYNPVVFCSLNKTNKTDYIREFCELMDITDDRLHLEKTPPYPDYMNHVTMANSVKGKWGDGDGKQNMYSFVFHLKKAFELLEQDKTQYDIVLYYRADIETKDDLTLTFPIEKMNIYIPQNNPHCDYDGGLCASFAYSNPSIMKIYCYMIDSIEYMCKQQGIMYHSETLLKKHMENNNIKVERFPYTHIFIAARHKPNEKANMD